MTRGETHFIRKARVGYLATVDETGEPSNVPFCYAFDGTTLYSPIDEKPKSKNLTALKRIRNIREDPRVCVVVNHYDDDWSRLGHVIIRGRAKVLLRGQKHQAAVRLLRRKYPLYRQMAIHERPIIAIQVTRHIAWGRI
jgi:PPOX class probable F420-dependent enzyme